MKKSRILALALVGCLGFGLVACGDGDTDDNGVVSHVVTAEQWTAAFSAETLLKNVTVVAREEETSALDAEELSWENARVSNWLTKIDTTKQIIYTAHWAENEEFDEQSSRQTVYTKEENRDYIYQNYNYEIEEENWGWWRYEARGADFGIAYELYEGYSYQLKYGSLCWQFGSFEDYTYNEEQEQYELNNDSLELYAWRSATFFDFRFYEPSVIIKFTNGKVSFIEVSGCDPGWSANAATRPYLKQTMTFSNYGTTEVSIPQITK